MTYLRPQNETISERWDLNSGHLDLKHSILPTGRTLAIYCQSFFFLSFLAHGRSPSENDHGDSQQDSPELREVSGTVTGEGQDFISLRPKTGALRPRWRLRQQDCQEKEKGDPAQGGANAAVVEMVVVAPRKEKRYECPECGHQARYLSEFIGHMGTHTRAYAGKRSHQCVECRKTFRQAAALYGHLRIHRSKSDSSNTKESFPKSFGSENQKMPNGGYTSEQFLKVLVADKGGDLNRIY